MKYIFSYLCLFFSTWTFAQMVNGTDSLYGDEWIDIQKTYYKIKLAEDGVYRLSYDVMLEAGLPMSTINGADFQLFAFGQEFPIYTSTDLIFDSQDYIEIYGFKNRGQIDKYLYDDWSKEQLNPDFSLFNDTLSYFLTWDNVNTHYRYEIIENDLSQTLPPKETYYMAEEQKLFSDKYYKPTFGSSAHIKYSSFNIQEGFGSYQLGKHTLSLPIDHLVENGINAHLKLRTGGNKVAHSTQISINNNLIHTLDYLNLKINNPDISFNTSLLSTSNTIKINGTLTAEKTILAYCTLIYPRSFHANNNSIFNFNPLESTSKKYFEIEAFDDSGDTFIVYDVNNSERLMDAFSNDDIKVKFILPQTTKKRHLKIVNSTTGIKSITQLKKHNFIDFSTLDPSYLILTSQKLNKIIQGKNMVTEYAAYRQSDEGGSYNVTIIDVESLYDQFAYGIDRHSLAIKNFGNKMKLYWNNWSYAFIIGKGLALDKYRSNSQINEDKDHFFVPTYGEIGSDNLLFSSDKQNYPFVAVGRLAATNQEQISAYLKKIKTQENHYLLDQTISGKHWTKNVLHLGGGNGGQQQNQFRDYLNNLKNVIENNEFGASVKSFFKSSTETIQSAVTNDLISYIDKGVAIISFLGHSSVGTFDFNIEQVDAYNNRDKYPILISMGCYSGNIHTVNGGLSHDFVIAENKGVIAFIASGGTAYANNLVNFSNNFYHLIGEDMYGESIGKVWQKVYENNRFSQSLGIETLIQQNTIHGDPAVKLFPHKAADYIIDYNSVKLTPKIISTADKDFSFDFDIVNLGKGIADSFTVKIVQYSSQDSILYEIKKRIKAPLNTSSIKVTIPIDNRKNIIGKNTIKITLDIDNEIQELPLPYAEQNNQLTNNEGTIGYIFYIVDNNAIPIYPSSFGITNGNLKLVSSISNIFLEAQKYILQIDTTNNFDTPIEEISIVQGGGMLVWEPNFTPRNKVVYYWRVSPDSTNIDIGYLWNTSSFLYHNDYDDGWNQSHSDQYRQDYFENLYVNVNNKLDYATNFIGYRVLNNRREVGKFPSFYIEDELMDYSNGYDIKSGVYIIVGDTVSTIPWINPKGGLYGSDTPENWVDRNVFPFKTETQEDRIEVMNFIANHIPDGNNVIFMNIQSAEDPSNAHEWAQDSLALGRSIFSVLKEQGATQISQLIDQPELPYIFAFRKNKMVLDELIGITPDAFIDKVIYFHGKWYEGNMLTDFIGPVKSWQTLLWSEQKYGTDISDLSIQVYNNNKQLIESITVADNSYIKSLSNIDASLYPYLKLNYHTKDSIDRSSAQIEQWRILYESLPEIAMNPVENLLFHADTLQKGELLNFEMNISNPSNTTMDSCLVHYTIIDDNNLEFTQAKTIPQMDAGTSYKLSYQFDTKDLNEDFTFKVDINPQAIEAELHTFNNILLKKVVLIKDEDNPILDVTFDGKRIGNNELVSTNPLINISVLDENKFLLINDISLFEIFLTDPLDNRQLVDLDSDEISFFPASNESNLAYISYNPRFIQSGTYKLEAQVKDASGNFSGNQKYIVSFNVLFEQQISNVLNYPNPFSNSTQFVFNLGGMQLPSDFSIRIYSLSGKVVKEISMRDFGNIRLGLNKTEYRWDGTDDYGELLANGIYLYHVTVKKSDGSNYDRLNASIDDFFKDGWGKLTIIR